MTDPFRRLVAAASKVCRLADDPDVFDEYNDSDELHALRDALADLDALLREVDPAPLPPADLPAPTLADILAVLLALPGAPGVTELAAELDGDQVEQVLRIALGQSDRGRQAELLVGMAKYLTEAQAERALSAVPRMDRASQQLHTVSALLPGLPPARRPATARFALAAARRVHPAVSAQWLVDLAPWLDDAQRVELYDIMTSTGDGPGSELCWLAAYFLPEQRTAVLAAIVGVADENHRAVLLGGIAPDLDETQLAAAVDAAAGITDPGFRARALAGIARSLPGPRRREVVAAALSGAREPGGGKHSYLAVDDLFALLEPDQLEDALVAAVAVRNDHARARALGLLGPLLPPAQLSAATAAAGGISEPGARAAALAALAPCLPENLRRDAVARAVDALVERPGGGWSRELRVLAPHLTPEQLARLWEMALREEREYPQHGLSTLAPYVDDERREQCFVLTQSYDAEHLVDALPELAPHLDAAQRRRAYQAACEIADLSCRGRALAGLVPYLSPPDAAEAAEVALASAASLRDPTARSALLTELAPRLEGSAHRRALAWAFAATTSIEPVDREAAVRRLTRLVPLLPESPKPT